MKNLILKTCLTGCLIFSSVFTIQTFAQIVVDTFPAGEMTEFAVPEGVLEITINAVGGSGGLSPGNGSPPVPGTGGCGVEATGTFPVSPGDILYIIVGAGGTDGNMGTRGDGGGGGGSAVINSTTGAVLLVSGGGGGGANGFQGGNGIASNGGVLGNGGDPGMGNRKGGSGGGAMTNGSSNNNGDTTGGSAGDPSGGSGGTAGSQGGNGGFGYGGGGGAGTNGGGGGGGAEGGSSGTGNNNNISIVGQGGTSYADDSGSDLSFAVSSCSSTDPGSISLSFQPIPIPTIGEWGLILLAICFGIIGLIYIKYKKPHILTVKG